MKAGNSGPPLCAGFWLFPQAYSKLKLNSPRGFSVSLDARAQGLEGVDLAREPGSDSTYCRIAALGDVPRSAGGIGGVHGFHAQLPDQSAALG